MENKKDAVSKKISKLRDEGKPQDQAVAIALDMEERGKLEEMIREEVMRIFEEKKDSNHPSQYSAPEGSKRDKQLDATKADIASGDPKRVARGYRRRERMEKAERKKKGFKNVPRSDTKKESVHMSKATLREMIRKTLEEELSKATKATLKKKAEKRGLTPSSVYAEFRKGLAAWASSGSRKGMSQHQWAHARVNAATPSKPWAVVKKAKKKKKNEVINKLREALNIIEEAEYQGRKVKLNDPIRTPGESKKFKVYVKNDKGNVVVVRFGDPNMEIKRDDPKRRKAFRDRHNCKNPGPKTKARFWSCFQWRAGAKVDN